MSHLWIAQTGEIWGLVVAAIIVGGWILRARAEAKAAQARRERGPQPPQKPQATGEVRTPQDEIDRFLAQIGRKPAREEPPTATPVDPQQPAPPTAVEVTLVGPARTAAQAPSRPVPRPATASRHIKPLQANIVEARKPARTVARPALMPAPPPAPVQRSRTAGQLLADLKGGPDALRKAVLLAEILGPPRALRSVDDRMTAL